MKRKSTVAELKDFNDSQATARLKECTSSMVMLNCNGKNHVYVIPDESITDDERLLLNAWDRKIILSTDMNAGTSYLLSSFDGGKFSSYRKEGTNISISENVYKMYMLHIY
jgi:hypothetical protein